MTEERETIKQKELQEEIGRWKGGQKNYIAMKTGERVDSEQAKWKNENQ